MRLRQKYSYQKTDNSIRPEKYFNFFSDIIIQYTP